VLARLRHDAFIRGHYEQRRVDASHAGQHILDEIDVSRHIDDPDRLRARRCTLGSARWWQRKPREAQIDRHLALFFFAQTIRIDTGQGQDQGRLAMVDVAGGADNSHLGLRLRPGSDGRADRVQCALRALDL